MNVAPSRNAWKGGTPVRSVGELRSGVGVVIPVHNRRGLVCEAIDSVLSQVGTVVEVVVVDDASTDGTADEVRARYAGRPVRVLANDRSRGPAGARNCGLAAVEGVYTALLDSDDVFLPGHLEACIALMNRHAQVDVVFGPARYVSAGAEIDYMRPGYERKLAAAPLIHEDADAVLLGPSFFEHLIRHGCFFNLSSVVFRTGAIQERMNEGLRLAEDYEFWMRLARSHAFGCLKAPQIVYRVHEENVSLTGDSGDDAHSSALLNAYRAVFGYPDLPGSLRRLLRERMAEVLFDWGYHARKSGHHAEAIAHHLGSLAKGRRVRNVAALVKIALEMGLAAGRVRL